MFALGRGLGPVGSKPGFSSSYLVILREIIIKPPLVWALAGWAIPALGDFTKLNPELHFLHGADRSPEQAGPAGEIDV